MCKRFDVLVALWSRYEHHLGLGGLVAGFLFDLVVADRPDSAANNLLLLGYLFISASIIMLFALRKRRARGALEAAEPLLLLLILQFCFGGLASNLLVLYGKSGTLAGSLFFLLLLLAMAVGNEFLRNRYALLRFNIAIYYLLLLTYCVIAVPTFLLHYIGLGAFFISGMVSLAVMAVFFLLLRLVLGDAECRSLLEGKLIVAAIFLLFSGAYWLQIIPPVPLSLKQAGVYHHIARSGPDSYTATFEAPPPYVFWRSTASTFHAAPGESAYCYSAVFAPAELSTPVYHRWEHWDAGAWETVSRVAFPIYGGRDQGYRGYTALSGPAEGKWRCSVETASGALIGRVGFRVERAASTTLTTTTL